MSRPPGQLPTADYDNIETRRRLARMLMQLFEHWELDSRAKLELLGMPATGRRRLYRLSAGTAPLPKGRDTRDRAAYLLAVHKGLRTLYPENPTLRYGWISRRNPTLDNLRPIEVMREQGLIGIARIARFVETLCSR